MITSGDFRILQRDDDGIYAMWRDCVLMQVRWGKLTVQALHATAPPLRAQLGAGRPVGFLVVIEPGAPIPSEEVRQHQRTVLDAMLANPALRMAVTMLGDDVSSALARSAGRLVAVGNPRIQRFAELTPGAQWLAHELATLGLKLSAAELVAAMDHLRQQPRPELPPGR